MNHDWQGIADIIENSWQHINEFSPQSVSPELQSAVDRALSGLDRGELRIAEKKGEKWVVNQWLKKAVLISFKLQAMTCLTSGLSAGEQEVLWYDKIKPKFLNWHEADFVRANIRTVPGSLVRYSAYLAPRVILMPCFVNLGAYVDEGTMIDTWSTIGSCAQIGKNVHISGGVGIGGVLEPLQSNPVIIEDHCFIGARSEIVEGVIVEEGAVIAMGVFIGASTKIVDRATGEIFYGRVPAYSVVVPGSLPGKSPSEPSLYCAVIVKRVDAKTRAKVSLNELLRT